MLTFILCASFGLDFNLIGERVAKLEAAKENHEKRIVSLEDQFATIVAAKSVKSPSANCKCTDAGGVCKCTHGECLCADCPARGKPKPNLEVTLTETSPASEPTVEAAPVYKQVQSANVGRPKWRPFQSRRHCRNCR